MGLFDKVFGKVKGPADETLSPQEAFLAVAVAIAAADGHIAQSEVETVFSYVGRMQMFRSATENQMRGYFDRLLRILKGRGPSALVDAAKNSLPHDLRETAFACAVDIALADGVLEDSEKEIIEQLYQALEVPDNIATTIIQVMLIKNRGA